MIRLLLSSAALLAACTPQPQETAMRSPSPDTGSPAGGTGEVMSGNRALPGPIPQPVSAAENRAPGSPVDSPAAAQGRRILSTAFVRVGPDGLLTVELRDGRALVLRDVAVRAKDYCGVQALGGARHCGGFAEIVAARPGGAPVVAEPDLAAANPLGATRDPAEGR